jgi:lysozyme
VVRVFLLIATVLVACEKPEVPTASSFPSRYAVHGVDVSHHNGVIDWPTVANAGVHFTWVKATEGADVRDERFRANATAAQTAGLAVGPYHVFTFCRPGAEQAANFLERIRGAPRSLPPAVDVEFVGNCRTPPPPADIRKQLERWLTDVELATGSQAVVYTTPDAAEQLLGGLDRRLWIRSIARAPTEPWTVWQFDASGRVPGIVGPVDLDVFSGDRAALDGLNGAAH